MKTRFEILKELCKFFIMSKNYTDMPLVDYDEWLKAIQSTEMFDISNYDCNDLPKTNIKLTNDNDIGSSKIEVQGEVFNDISLPFETVLIKVGEREQELMGQRFHLENHVFLNEVDVNEFVGFLICTLEAIDRPDVETEVHLDLIQINVAKEGMTILFKEEEDETQLIMAHNLVLRSITTLQKLNKCKVYDYTLNHFSTKYIRSKGKPTIKITNRPIYYVLDRKDNESVRHINTSQGRLSCSYAFKVRGHWRTLHNPKSFGVNRNDERIVQGYTWIKEYIKGEGELIKRVRLVK